MAKFKYKYGVMNSGKSQELLRVVYNYQEKGQNVLVLTSPTDDRFGIGVVKTRSGNKTDAFALNTIGELYNIIQSDTYLQLNPACVLIDEVQFFNKELINEIKRYFVIENNIPVIAYGLRSTFNGDLFEGSSACFAIADDVSEIETVCTYCNKKAVMNLLLKEVANKEANGDILIGDEAYKPVCYKHWLTEGDN